MSSMNRWRGLKALVQDAVEHGSRAVERVHMQTARRPFAILEQIPPIAAPTRVVHVVHDVTVTTSYAAVRLVNRVVGATVDIALDAVSETTDEPPGGERMD
jgi:hypothetical protein